MYDEPIFQAPSPLLSLWSPSKFKRRGGFPGIRSLSLLSFLQNCQQLQSILQKGFTLNILHLRPRLAHSNHQYLIMHFHKLLLVLSALAASGTLANPVAMNGTESYHPKPSISAADLRPAVVTTKTTTTAKPVKTPVCKAKRESNDADTAYLYYIFPNPSSLSSSYFPEL